MGGDGSGRSGGRPTVEDSLSLQPAAPLQDGLAEAGRLDLRDFATVDRRHRRRNLLHGLKRAVPVACCVHSRAARNIGASWKSSPGSTRKLAPPRAGSSFHKAFGTIGRIIMPGGGENGVLESCGMATLPAGRSLPGVGNGPWRKWSRRLLRFTRRRFDSLAPCGTRGDRRGGP
jgi:hypothetical protein